MQRRTAVERGMTLKAIDEARRLLSSEAFTETAVLLSGGTDLAEAYRTRLLRAIDTFTQHFGSDREIAVVARRTDRTICVKSEGFPADVISLDELEPVTDQKPTAAELIRGAAAWFQQYGCPLDTGFDAYTTSQVMPGSGLSSSAAFEVLLGNICNALYADNRFTPVELAQMGQYAENVYFHKPCGLMDQMASSVGGAVAIDFANPVKPVVHPVKFDFSSTGYALCIVDTGGNHADLTEEYAAIPREMGAVAKYFGKDVLSEVKSEQVLRSIPELRKACGDRAVLRAMHFYREDGRAQGESDALERGDFEAFLHLVQNSGESSYCLLQNVYPSSVPAEQPVSIAIAVGSAVLGGRGAIRVHGGGFGGTVQAFVPSVLLTQFRDGMEAVLGEGCCHVLQIRPIGGMTILI